MCGVDFRITRSPVPVIWLDSSILIKRGRIRAGAALHAADQNRIQYLHENIYDLVRSGQLICPEANQPSEIWHNRDALSSVVNEYSLGVRASHPHVVQDRQEKRAMRAHALGARVVELPHTDLFSTDPTMTIRENLSQPIFISIVETPSAELIEQFEADRAWIHQEWEALRTTLVGDRVSYAQQLGGELEGETRVIFDLAQSYLEKLESGEEPSSKEFFRYIRVVRMISEWDGLTNGALDVRGLKRFLRSAHYAGLPSVFVSAALTAALLTGNRPIQSGTRRTLNTFP